MNPSYALGVAVIFTWLGMVVAISFIEAPLKFRAPGVSLQIGLGIGRLVFRALNTIEAILGAVLLIIIGIAPPSATVVGAVVVVVASLAVQLLAIRPKLTRRSDLVLAGTAAPAEPDRPVRRSRIHYGYVGLELLKVIALVVAGVALLAAG